MKASWLHMEKRKPHYSLDAIKKQFRGPKGFRITVTAQDFAFGVLGLDRQGIIDLVENIRSSQFHKSMTSYRGSSVWQDVYHVAHEASFCTSSSRRTPTASIS